MPRAEMPAEHAILGLLWLAEADGSGYGYDLARHFTDGQPLAEILRLEPGMLYHHLKKLERAAWVTAERDASGTRPPRRVYRLTAAGKAQLLTWLGEPVSHTREIRLELLVKLYFARRLDPGRATRLLAEQLTTLERIAASLAARIDQFDHDASSADPADRGFTHLVLALRLSQTQAAIAWVEGVTRQLDAW